MEFLSGTLQGFMLIAVTLFVKGYSLNTKNKFALTKKNKAFSFPDI